MQDPSADVVNAAASEIASVKHKGMNLSMLLEQQHSYCIWLINQEQSKNKKFNDAFEYIKIPLAADQAEIESLSATVLEELKNRVRDVKPTDYIIAQRFLKPYNIDVDSGIVYSVGEGKIEAADFRDLSQRFSADPLYHPDLDHLFDGRLVVFSFSGKEAWGLGFTSKRNRPTAKTAIVINSAKWSRGYIRMYLGYAEGNRSIFDNMEPAREWLCLPPEE